jgi:glycosyltransferase involved in cell wall biosynthesis
VRLASIVQAYEAAGWQTFCLCVHPEEQPVPRGTVGTAFPKYSPLRLFNGENVPYTVDLRTGSFATEDAGAWRWITETVPPAFDAVHVEQPWLWPVAEKLMSSAGRRDAVLVYGAQNIEGELKRRILQRDTSLAAEAALAAIDALEKRATRTADLVIAVTEDEKSVLQSWGAAHVELAANGISRWQATEESLAKWREKLPKAPWLLYVASSHPPNYAGFADLIGDSLACIPPDSRLVIAGGVAARFERILRESKWRALNSSRVQLLHTLDDADLSAVRSLAHGYFLPVSFGSGSNIKTAEALISGKYVVGTTVAFRGYEDFVGLPEVRVADRAQQVHSAVTEILSLPPLDGTSNLAMRDRLTWQHTLRGLPAAVDAAVQRKAAARGAAVG